MKDFRSEIRVSWEATGMAYFEGKHQMRLVDPCERSIADMEYHLIRALNRLNDAKQLIGLPSFQLKATNKNIAFEYRR